MSTPQPESPPAAASENPIPSSVRSTRSTRRSTRSSVPPSTTRTTRSSRRRAVQEEVQETPAPSTNFDKFKGLKTPLEEDEEMEEVEETPRPRRTSRRGGGKYHPGQRPAETPGGVLESSPALPRKARSTRASSRLSSRASSRASSVISDAPQSDVPQEESDNESHISVRAAEPVEEEHEEQQAEQEEEHEVEQDEEQDEEQEVEQPEDAADTSASSDIEFDEMDQTIRVNIDTPLSKQLPSHAPSTIKPLRNHLRSSPGATPARKNFHPFSTPGRAYTSKSVQTPRQLNFANPSVPPSFFDAQKTPFLAAGSPFKRPTLDAEMDPIPYENYGDADMEGVEADDWVNPEDADEFLQFSPEKQLPRHLGTPLTVRKTRTPFKLHPIAASSPVRQARANDDGTPVKDFIGLGERFAGVRPKDDAEEREKRKEMRRRRITAEFRQFSEIDLKELKAFAQQTIPEEKEEEEGAEKEEAAQEKAQENEDEVMTDRPDENEETKEAPQETEGGKQSPKLEKAEAAAPKGADDGEDTLMEDRPAEQTEAKTEAVQAEQPSAESKPEDAMDAEPTTSSDARSSSPLPEPFPARLFRPRRSLSCPPTPTPDLTRQPSPEQLLIQRLRERILDLEYGLRETKQKLANETRIRHAAQETIEFLNLERAYGVCCEHGSGAHRAEKRGKAAIPLPSSPPSEASAAPPPARTLARPASRLRERPESRLGQAARPESRLGAPPAARPASRLGVPARATRTATTSTATAATAASTAAAAASKKRPRDEPPNRKPAIARPEKRVLSSATNIAARGESALAKKPEKIGIGRAAGTRAASGAAAGGAVRPGSRLGGLGRGARR